MRAQVSEVIYPAKLARELDLMFRILVPPNITIFLFIIIIFVPIPTLTIVSSFLLIPYGLLVSLMVR